MIRRIVCIVILLGVCFSSLAKEQRNQRIDSLMSRLDSVIADRPRYLAMKEKRLSQLKGELAAVDDDHRRFDIIGQLVDEYSPFNTDSAYRYSELREAVANTIGDPTLIVNARMNQANILSSIGMYTEAMELMEPITSAGLPDYLRPYYFHIQRTLYGRMADYSAFDDDRIQYLRLTDLYRDSLLLVNPPGTLSNVIVRADQLNERGEGRKAIEVMTEFMEQHELSEHERAICAWTLSESYAQVGDTASQKEQLIISAISDMKSAVREYISLRALALLLYREGDLDRAYDFMNISMEDASKSNARHRILEINETYPAINGIYVNKVRDQKRSLWWALCLITVLLLFLFAVLLYLRKQMRHIAQARCIIEENNDQLQLLNSRLTQSNRELSEANRSITENSRLKETYIGRYMDQCMEYIEKLDSYRKTIRKVAQSIKSDELKTLVKSSADLDWELKSFYDNFDATFLKLFPTFVDDFNRLLRPEEAIIPKRAGSLTTELRIFALIRLGITDSDSIAKFLRYSLTTIYNYRTRVRNKAVGDRSQLEKQVLLIGRPEL